MIKALLLDLDGTLLPLDTDGFLRHYLKSIAAHVAHLTDPKEFVDSLMASTEVMVKNTDKTRTNKEVFWDDFLKRVNVPEEQLMPVLDDFYANQFPKLVKYTSPTPLSKQIVETAAEKGLRVVVATNPVFPTEAIQERLRWIGVEDYPFDLVTTYEIMHFCKPQIGYYQEILEMTGLDPKECLMAGNDPLEDLVASKLGMKTFLVEDYVITRKNVDFVPDYQGSLRDLLEFVERL